MPETTILIPAYNAATQLPHTLTTSIHQQGYSDYDILIINDGSTDTTGETLEHLAHHSPVPITILHHENNQGVAAALNTGLSHCTSRYIVRADCDDLNHPRRLAILTSIMNRYPHLTAAGSAMITAAGTTHPPRGEQNIKNRIPYRNCFAHPTMILDNHRIQGKGYSYPNQQGVEDYGLWLTMLTQGNHLDNCTYPLVKYRAHSHHPVTDELMGDTPKWVASHAAILGGFLGEEFSDQEVGIWCEHYHAHQYHPSHTMLPLTMKVAEELLARGFITSREDFLRAGGWIPRHPTR